MLGDSVYIRSVGHESGPIVLSNSAWNSCPCEALADIHLFGDTPCIPLSCFISDLYYGTANPSTVISGSPTGIFNCCALSDIVALVMQGNIMKATAPVGELDALAYFTSAWTSVLLGLLRAEGGTRGVRLAGTLSSLKDVDLSVVPEFNCGGNR